MPIFGIIVIFQALMNFKKIHLKEKKEGLSTSSCSQQGERLHLIEDFYIYSADATCDFTLNDSYVTIRNTSNSYLEMTVKYLLSGGVFILGILDGIYQFS